MKRIIDGVTYNTDTATLIARADEDYPYDDLTNEAARTEALRLYQTRGGAFFLHIHTRTSRRNSEREWRDIELNEFTPMTADEAQSWVNGTQCQVELLNDVFGEPPEAAAEEVMGATLYIRVPASLKERIDTAAKGQGLSVNAWLMRCTEGCVRQQITHAVASE
jgi:hypothetical protein